MGDIIRAAGYRWDADKSDVEIDRAVRKLPGRLQAICNPNAWHLTPIVNRWQHSQHFDWQTAATLLACRCQKVAPGYL